MADVDDPDALGRPGRGRGGAGARSRPGPSAVVGSSRSKTLGFESSALTTSSICRSPSESVPTAAPGLRLASNAFSRSAAQSSMRPNDGRCGGGNGKEQVLRHRQLEQVRIGLVDHSEPEAPSIGGVSGVEAARRRSRRCLHRERDSRSRSRAVSTSRTRSHRRRRGSRLLGTPRLPLATPAQRRNAWRRPATRGRRSRVRESSTPASWFLSVASLLLGIHQCHQLRRYEVRWRSLGRDGRDAVGVRGLPEHDGMFILAGIVAPLSFIIATVSATRDWKFRPYPW